jgi:branched-subunit amino acid aminotransferase/4-amino-4-deoxychorismate lyase
MRKAEGYGGMGHWASDSGFLLGYGAFETVLVAGGRAVALEAHLERMRKGLSVLGLAFPQGLKEAVESLLRRRPLERGSLRIQVTARVERGLEVTGKPRVSVWLRPGDPYARARKVGVEAGVVRGVIRNELSPLCRVKALSFAENVLAFREARQKGWEEGILLNRRGELAEGSRSNLFWVRGGVIETPGEASGLLPGVTRERVVRLAREMGMEVREGSWEPSRIQEAEEIFLTSSLMGVLPVIRWEGRPVGKGVPGEVAARLGQELEGFRR